MAWRAYKLPDGSVEYLDERIPQEDAFKMLWEKYPDLFGIKPAPEGGVLRGIKEGVKGVLGGGVGAVQTMGEGVLSVLPGDMGQPGSAEHTVTSGLRELLKPAHRAFAPGEGYEDTFLRKATSAVGSTAPYAAAGLLTGGWGLPVLLGAASGAGEAKQRQEEKGVPQEGWRTVMGAAAGSLEGLPWGGIGARLSKSLGVTTKSADEAFKIIAAKWGPEKAKMLGQWTLSTLKQGGYEAVQENVTNALQNIIEQDYNPERKTFDQWEDSALYGGVAGATIEGLFGIKHAGRMNQLARSLSEEAAAKAPPAPPGEQLGLFGPSIPPSPDAGPQGDLFAQPGQGAQDYWTQVAQRNAIWEADRNGTLNATSPDRQATLQEIWDLRQKAKTLDETGRKDYAAAYRAEADRLQATLQETTPGTSANESGVKRRGKGQQVAAEPDAGPLEMPAADAPDLDVVNYAMRLKPGTPEYENFVPIRARGALAAYIRDTNNKKSTAATQRRLDELKAELAARDTEENQNRERDVADLTEQIKTTGEALGKRLNKLATLVGRGEKAATPEEAAETATVIKPPKPPKPTKTETGTPEPTKTETGTPEPTKTETGTPGSTVANFTTPDLIPENANARIEPDGAGAEPGGAGAGVQLSGQPGTDAAEGTPVANVPGVDGGTGAAPVAAGGEGAADAALTAPAPAAEKPAELPPELVETAAEYGLLGPDEARSAPRTAETAEFGTIKDTRPVTKLTFPDVVGRFEAVDGYVKSNKLRKYNPLKPSSKASGQLSSKDMDAVADHLLAQVNEGKVRPAHKDQVLDAVTFLRGSAKARTAEDSRIRKDSAVTRSNKAEDTRVTRKIESDANEMLSSRQEDASGRYPTGIKVVGMSTDPDVDITQGMSESVLEEVRALDDQIEDIVHERKAKLNEEYKGYIKDAAKREAYDKSSAEKRDKLIAERGALLAEANKPLLEKKYGPEAASLFEIGNRLGVRVILVKEVVPKGRKATKFNGFVLRDVPGYERTVFVNVGAKDPHLRVFGHEFVHVLRNLSDVAYKRLEEVVMKSLNLPAQRLLKAHRDLLKKKTATTEQLLEAQTAIEDFVADTVGHRMAQPEFWKQLEGYINPQTTSSAAPTRSAARNTMMEIIRAARNVLYRVFKGKEYKPFLEDDLIFTPAKKDFYAIDQQLNRLMRDLSRGADADAAPFREEGDIKFAPYSDNYERVATPEGGFEYKLRDDRPPSPAVATATEYAAEAWEPREPSVSPQVLFSVLPQTSDLKKQIESEELIVGAFKDPAPGLIKSSLAWLKRNREASLKDYSLLFRTQVANSLAPQEEAYRGQQTFRKDGEGVSYVNGYGKAAAATQSGKLAENVIKFGKLVRTKWGWWAAQESETNSVRGIALKLQKLGAAHPDGLTLAHMSMVFSNYLYARRIRAIEKYVAEKKAVLEAAKGNSQKQLQLAKTNLARDVQRLEGWLSNTRFTEEKVQKSLAYENEFPGLKDLAQDVYSNIAANVDALVLSGRITKEMGDAYKRNEGYVPMFRANLDESAFNNMLDNAMLRRSNKDLRGPKQYHAGMVDLGPLPELSEHSSDAPIEDIFVNLVRFTYWTTNQAMRADAARQLIDDPEAVIWNGGAPPEKLRGAMEAKRYAGTGTVVEIYRDGEVEYYRLNDPLSAAGFKGLEHTHVWPLFKGFANLLRKSVTLMPGFSLAQLPQDSFRAALLSGVRNPSAIPTKVLSGFANSLYVTWGNAALDKTGKALALGGVAGDYDFSEHGAEEMIKQLTGMARPGVFKKTIDKLEQMSVASDLSQRRAVYEQTLKETKEETGEEDITLAQVRAREIINFNRTGASRTISALRQVVPFMNAYIQGMDVLYRTMRGMQQTSGKMTKGQGIKLFWAHMTKLIALSTAYALLMSGDDEYESMADWERDRFMLIPGTKGLVGEQSLRIPVPQEVGFIFKAIPERTVRLLRDEVFEKGTSEQAAKAVFKAIGHAIVDGVGSYSSPNLLPQAYRPMLEVAVNYSMFTGSPIEGRGMERWDKSERYTGNTSEIAKYASQILSYENIGLSPVQIDYLIRSMLGMTGVAVMAAGDATLSPLVGRPESRPSQIARAATLGAFVGSEVSQGWNEKYYNMREKVENAYGTMLNAQKYRDPEMAREIAVDRRDLLKVRPIFNKLDQMKEVNRAKVKQIENAVRQGHMSPEEGRQRIDQVQKAEQQYLAKVMPVLTNMTRGVSP